MAGVRAGGQLPWGVAPRLDLTSHIWLGTRTVLWLSLSALPAGGLPGQSLWVDSLADTCVCALENGLRGGSDTRVWEEGKKAFGNQLYIYIF